MTTSTLDLDQLHLAEGSHSSREEGVCLMEAVRWYAGEDHSDMPTCVSPVLRSYGMRLNDGLADADRQQLKQFIPALVGTASDGRDDARQALARRVLLTEWLPQWLRLANLNDLAERAEAAADLNGAELNTALWAIRDLTWKARQERWEPYRAKIRAAVTEAVKAKLAEQGKPAAAVADAAAAAAAAAAAVADAAAVAAAVAVAAAAAAADAAAAAAAAADAAAVAAAAAAADAVAAADAAADAAAAAAAALKPYSDEWYAWYAWRNRLYTDVKKAVTERLRTEPAWAQVEQLRQTQLQQAIDLYDRMIHVGAQVNA